MIIKMQMNVESWYELRSTFKDPLHLLTQTVPHKSGDRSKYSRICVAIDTLNSLDVEMFCVLLPLWIHIKEAIWHICVNCRTVTLHIAIGTKIILRNRSWIEICFERFGWGKYFCYFEYCSEANIFQFSFYRKMFFIKTLFSIFARNTRERESAARCNSGNFLQSSRSDECRWHSFPLHVHRATVIFPFIAESQESTEAFENSFRFRKFMSTSHFISSCAIANKYFAGSDQKDGGKASKSGWAFSPLNDILRFSLMMFWIAKYFSFSAEFFPWQLLIEFYDL